MVAYWQSIPRSAHFNECLFLMKISLFEKAAICCFLIQIPFFIVFCEQLHQPLKVYSYFLMICACPTIYLKNEKYMSRVVYPVWRWTNCRASRPGTSLVKIEPWASNLLKNCLTLYQIVSRTYLLAIYL